MNGGGTRMANFSPSVGPARTRDRDSLKKIWKESFGDSDEFIDMFFSEFYKDGMATIIDFGSIIPSAGYSLSGYELISPDFDPIPLTYGYSIATLPEYRSIAHRTPTAMAPAKSTGFGTTLTQGMCKDAFKKHKSAFCVCPAEDSLREWYGKIIKTRDFFVARERSMSAEEFKDISPTLSPRAVSAVEYNEARDSLLTRCTHVRFPYAAMEYQALICRFTRGGLYRFDGGCAVVEGGDDVLRIKELIVRSEDDFLSATAALVQLHGAKSAVVRSPFYGGGKIVQTTMVSLAPKMMLPSVSEPYWGPVFD